MVLRLWTAPDSAKNDKESLFVEKHKLGDLHPLVKCDNKASQRMIHLVFLLTWPTMIT